MAIVRDDVAVEECRRLKAEKAELTRLIGEWLRRARELKREIQMREAFLPHIQQ